MLGKGRWFLILALAAGSALAAATPAWTTEVDPPATRAAPRARTLDELLNALEVPFTRQDNTYMAVWTNDDGTSTRMVFIANELAQMDDGTPITFVTMLVPVIAVPEGTNPPAALLRKLSDITFALDMGSVVYAASMSMILYQSSFLLNDATVDGLGLQLAYAMLMLPEIQRELRPFIAD